MSTSPSLSDLLGRYLDLRERDQLVSPEDLCRDAPEQLEELRREIAGLESMENLLGVRTTPLLDSSGEQGILPGRRTGPLLPPGTVVAGYELLEELGRGGMAVVYKARQTSLKRIVALKMVLAGDFARPEVQRRFLAEAEVIAGLKHPHVVQVFECGTHEGQPYFSMELCEAGSLARHLDEGPLDSRATAELLRQLAGAVQAAHDKGVIQRDLKPGNVLLALASGRGCGEEPRPEAGANWVPKIADFGLAKQVGSDLTETRVVFGTPSYMPPEQTIDARAIDHRADVYALGAILYECLTGRPPFRAATFMDTLDQVRNRDPVPPRRLRPDVPRDLETVCLKCLEKQPKRRYPSARALADDLRCFLEGRPIQARSAGPGERAVKWARRRPAAAALIAVTALAGLVIAGLVAWDHARLQTTNGEL